MWSSIIVYCRLVGTLALPSACYPLWTLQTHKLLHRKELEGEKDWPYHTRTSAKLVQLMMKTCMHRVLVQLLQCIGEFHCLQVSSSTYPEQLTKIRTKFKQVSIVECSSSYVISTNQCCLGCITAQNRPTSTNSQNIGILVIYYYNII